MSERQIPQFPELQILSIGDLAAVYEFARERSPKDDPFAEWSAPWRKESLEHYLKIGWSMARRDSKTGRLQGYVLAQPFLFMRKQTQTVWIEHVDAETPAIISELVDTIVRIGREKHMQRVMIEFSGLGQGLTEVIRARNGRMIEDDILEFATTISPTGK